jgi:hypothetical protein
MISKHILGLNDSYDNSALQMNKYINTLKNKYINK